MKFYFDIDIPLRIDNAFLESHRYKEISEMDENQKKILNELKFFEHKREELKRDFDKKEYFHFEYRFVYGDLSFVIPVDFAKEKEMTQEELTTEGLDALKQFVVLIAKKVVEG